MRLINVEDLHDGMVLGCNIEAEGRVIFERGTVLREVMFNDIKAYTCNGVVSIMDLLDLQPMIMSDKLFTRLYLNVILSNMNVALSDCAVDRTQFYSLDERLRCYLENNRKVLYDLLLVHKSHKYTFNHSVNVAMYALIAGLSLGLTDGELHEMLVGALLHDIGKCSVSQSILDKPAMLSEEEFESIKKHPQLGLDVVNKNYDVSQNSKDVIIQHHEKLDGSGYPYNLTGKRINPLSTIVTVCDIFDAITSDRSYHKGVSVGKGSVVLREEAASGKLSSEVVENFLTEMILYPVNTFVKLSNGDAGFVVKSSLKNKPEIRSVYNDKLVDLNKESDLQIVDSV